MYPLLSSLTVFASGLLLCTQVIAAQSGWRQFTVPGNPPENPPITVALYYPTQTQARAIAMGPFTLRVAIQAPPEDKVKGLIVLSHGVGGTELGHTSLAEGLAQQGYLVASLRHPGDNWLDRSLLQASAARYFSERPRHVSRVIDALLLEPEWGRRISRDARGPYVGAIGHSAGGYTVLALAGARPELARIASHCERNRADDPIFCSMGRTGQPDAVPGATAQLPLLVDPRVRAVVALAPVGVVFSAESLSGVKVPTVIYGAQQDRFLVPRFHSDWVASKIPGVEYHRVPNAWHFAFMDAPSTPIVTEDGDIAANPPGFDRSDFLRRLQGDLPAFFDRAFR